MAEVLLGQAYFLRFDPKLWASMQPYPPLGSMFAASYLRTRGYDVALFDAMLARSEAEWGEALDRHQPEFAVLFEDNFNYLSKMCLLRMREAAFSMIKMAKARGAKVIVCGADATDHAQRYTDEGADYVLLGEGEETLGELLDELTAREPHPVESILGLAHPDDQRLVQLNPKRRVMKQLDTLPLPAWDLIDMARYQSIWKTRHGYYSVNMVTTRGCPYHCNWCAKPIWGQRYNSRSPENVVEELSLVSELCRPNHVWFADDIFGLKPGWTERYGELVTKHGVKTPFKALSRADLLLRKGEISALKNAGCELLWMGAESGSQKVLDAMDKGTKVEDIFESTRLLKAAGIRVGFFLQFGYPGEDLDDIEKTFQMVRDTQPDEIGISVSYPLPGTKFHERVKSQLTHKQNWIDSGDLDMMYEGPFTTAFYRKLHSVLHKELKSARARRDLMTVRPWRMKQHDVRRALGMVYRTATLPWDRIDLWRLAKIPHAGVRDIGEHMSHEEAATPSPQD